MRTNGSRSNFAEALGHSHCPSWHFAQSVRIQQPTGTGSSHSAGWTQTARARLSFTTHRTRTVLLTPRHGTAAPIRMLPGRRAASSRLMLTVVEKRPIPQPGRRISWPCPGVRAVVQARPLAWDMTSSGRRKRRSYRLMQRVLRASSKASWHSGSDMLSVRYCSYAARLGKEKRA